MIEQFNILTNPGLRITFLVLGASFMLLEYLLSRLAQREKDTHDLTETAASFGVAIGQNLIRALEAGIVAAPFLFAYRHRLLDFSPFTLPALTALLLLTEFAYYWHHRAAHRIRWLWATHSVHHSTTKLNFTAAIRLGWTGNVSGNFLFLVPLAWIGFHPLAIATMLAINLMYQFFIHTEFAPRLGPLEWVLNTPAHHRVHHACNESCLDKNFGGILIIFDRLFGTFAGKPEHEKLRYGLVNGAVSNNPFRIAFGEWVSMLADARKAPTLRAKLRALFASPGSGPSMPPAVSSAQANPKQNPVFLRRVNHDQTDDVLLVYDQSSRCYRLPRNAGDKQRRRTGSGVA